MVMNLPVSTSSTTTSFTAARKSPGSECMRASARKLNFAIAMSAAAWMPFPVTSPRTTASRPRGRLVDVADLEPADVGQLTREERALHRLGEVLLLLVETSVVDGKGGL